MAKNTYRVSIKRMEPAANGTIMADAELEYLVSKNPDVWQLAINGHQTMVLTAAEVSSITESSMNNTQKTKALEELVWNKAMAAGISTADDAYQSFVVLLPPPFTVTEKI